MQTCVQCVTWTALFCHTLSWHNGLEKGSRVGVEVVTNKTKPDWINKLADDAVQLNTSWKSAENRVLELLDFVIFLGGGGMPPAFPYYFTLEPWTMQEWVENCFIKTHSEIYQNLLEMFPKRCIHLIFLVHGIWALIPWPLKQSKFRNCNLLLIVTNKNG